WQPKELVAVLGSHSGRHWAGSTITCVCWSHDGKRIYSGGLDGRVRVWDAHGLRELFSLSGPDHKVLGIAASSDGRYLAACGTDLLGSGWGRVWKVETEGFEEYATFAWSGDGCSALAFSPDGRRLAAAAGGWRGEVCLWDIKDDGLKEFY